ncbi:MAG: single-stranded DNA-binding protein [Patescibacteria group bacterium]|nr:single-stranded DNA-binding protein [Patescibacteria group bacterium]
MDLNKVFILGRLTADPQLRSIPSGTQVATFSVATNRVWNDKSGARQEQTEYHNIVVWGRQAEVAGQFLKKGGMVLVEGRLQTRSWQDKQGQTRKTTEIISERLQLGPRSVGKSSEAPSQANMENNEVSADIPTIDVEDKEINPEDLPF